MFADVPEILREGDLLVLNDTRVTGRRLIGRRQTGGKVEVVLIDRLGPGEYRALTRPAGKLQIEDQIFVDGLPSIRVIEDEGEGLKRLRFADTAQIDEKIAIAGVSPLPPYIHERLENEDRYQTVYGVHGGSSAAPTAGLHFTKQMLDRLKANGVGIASVTLHVGLDTFRPMKVDDYSAHAMHGEGCSIPVQTAEAIESCTGRIVAVGTTSVRTLESFASGNRRVSPGEMDTRTFITPGYRFQIVDGMFTNFHLPRTTMLLMISALASREFVLAAYRQAIAERYRFLSFGDSMLII
jgi:S-adenosylmethionine:tRNA ribosyltransferase-isomerase